MSAPGDEAGRALPLPKDPAVGSAPVVLEVRDVDKEFRIPEHRIDSFKERAVRPFSSTDFRRLQALDGASFDVHQGEFFGIVGRNGSGKSTLLKILASIYRADRGTIRMAGRVAPFIELGVGFNPDLSARENVILNAVMMGLSPREARLRLDAIFAFAELEEFTELKLKNYSSGMSVRLAFSVMLQVDADILLIDEVLAVGDAAFQQKCTDVFHEMRDAGKTVVLVTHDMLAIETFCHRAMLLHDGEIDYIGDPGEVARRYYRLNFERADTPSAEGVESVAVDVHARVVEASLENADGVPITNLEQGTPIRFSAIIEASTDLDKPHFSIQCISPDGQHVFGYNRTLRLDEGEQDRLTAGQRVRISGVVDNPLNPGRYFIACWISRDRTGGDLALQAFGLLDFVVYGTARDPGIVRVNGDVEVVAEIDSPRREPVS